MLSRVDPFRHLNFDAVDEIFVLAFRGALNRWPGDITRAAADFQSCAAKTRKLKTPMKKTTLLALLIGAFVVGCQKPTVQAPASEPAAPTSAPAPIVERKPTPIPTPAATPAQTTKRTAPPGMLFLTRSVTFTTEHGILRFSAGTQIEIVSEAAGNITCKVGADVITVSKEDTAAEWVEETTGRARAPQVARNVAPPAESYNPPAPVVAARPPAVQGIDQQKVAESRIRLRQLEASVAVLEQRREAISRALNEALSNYRERRIITRSDGSTTYRREATKASGGSPPDSPENRARQSQIRELDRQITAIRSEMASLQQVAAGR